MKVTASLLIFSALVGLAPPVLADSKTDEARARFQRGVELYKEGSLDAALAEFNKAYDLVPNYRVLYNMAQVQTERHDYVAALKLLERYLEEGGGEVTTERKEQVTKELSVLRGRVSELTVKTELEGAELLLDGVPAGTTPLKDAVLVNAGVRQVQLRKEGYEPSTQTLTVAGGEDLKIEFELKPLRAAEAPLPSVAPSVQEPAPIPQEDRPREVDEGGSNAPMWITLVTTGLFAGGAVTFGLLTRKSDEDLDKELNRIPADSDRIEDSRDELKRNALLTDAFTGAAVISGGFFLYFALSGSSSSSQSTNSGVRVVPAGTGVRVLGNF
jgi:hypothetical protein